MKVSVPIIREFHFLRSLPLGYLGTVKKKKIHASHDSYLYQVNVHGIHAVCGLFPTSL